MHRSVALLLRLAIPLRVRARGSSLVAGVGACCACMMTDIKAANGMSASCCWRVDTIATFPAYESFPSLIGMQF